MRQRACGLAILTAALAAWLASCTVDPKPDYRRAAEHIAGATGHADAYQPGDDASIDARVRDLCADGVTADDAVRMCLLNNPRLQAAFYDVGVARADVVQSQLFSNPSIGLSFRLPDGGGLANLEASFSQNIVELWQIPVRKRAAERDLEQVILSLAHEVSTSALDAKAAFFTAIQADRADRIARDNVAVARQLVELATGRQQAGAGSQVDVNLAQSELLEAQLAERTAALAAFEGRAALCRHLGLREPPTHLRLVDPAADGPVTIPAPEALMAAARENRLDVRAAENASLAAHDRWQLEKLNVFRTIEIGVAMERGERRTPEGRNILADTARSSLAAGQLAAPELEPKPKSETDFMIGPTLGVELPLFDQNQAQIARAEYQYRQTARKLDALLIELTQEARLACERANVAADNAKFYREQILPLRETSLSLSREAYQAGRVAFLSVLEAERALLNARAGHVEALHAAATAAVEIEKIAGRPLNTLAAGAVKAAPGTRPTSSQPGEPESKELRP